MNDPTLRLEDNAKIIDLLSRNAEILNRVSRFQVAFKQLELNQKKLLVLCSKLVKDITNYELIKNSQREKLVGQIIPVIRIMQVFAHDRNKENLQRRLYFLTTEKVKNSADDELINISKKIWLIANKYGGFSLTFSDRIKSLLNPDNSKDTQKFERDYGLNGEMIENLERAILGFIESMVLFNREMEQKEMLRLKVKKMNKQTKKLMARKIDRFAILFESENPDFYNEYCRIRGDQFPKQVMESLKQESDPIELVVEEVPVENVKQKAKPKTPKKKNSENNQ
jgi:hypothetical protein